MANKMLIDATHPEETRVVVLRGNRVEEFDFEIGQPQTASRQHLSRQGHAGRTVAAGGLRRLRRQPPRLPGLLRNPSRLLPDPGRRPAGADRRRRARRARRRGREHDCPRRRPRHRNARRRGAWRSHCAVQPLDEASGERSTTTASMPHPAETVVEADVTSRGVALQEGRDGETAAPDSSRRVV